MDEQWIITEARLWKEFMAPARPRIVLHSLTPEKRKEVRLDLEKQKSKEFGKEWEAYDRWMNH